MEALCRIGREVILILILGWWEILIEDWNAHHEWKIISTKVNKEALSADQVDKGLVAEAIEAQVKTKNQS